MQEMNDFWIAIAAIIALFGLVSALMIIAIWWTHKYRFGSKNSEGEKK